MTGLNKINQKHDFYLEILFFKLKQKKREEERTENQLMVTVFHDADNESFYTVFTFHKFR
jgi:hypothetical protein